LLEIITEEKARKREEETDRQREREKERERERFTVVPRRLEIFSFSKLIVYSVYSTE